MAQHRKKKKRTQPLAVLIFVLVVILAVLVAVAIRLSETTPSGEPEGTTTAPPQTSTAPPQTTATPDGTTLPTETTQPTETADPYGWQTEDGQTVYLLPDGSRASGWQDIDGSRYYFDADGVMVTGWLELEGQRYYLRGDGTMARGAEEIDGTVSYFTSSGAYILVANPWNFIPDGYEPDLVSLPDEIGEGHQVDRSCYDALLQMIDACNAAMKEEYSGTGQKVPRAYVISSYRTHEYQTNAYNNKINRVMNADPSLTREEAEIEAAKVVAYPGTSEHQLGLAVDIIDTQLWALEQEQENLAAQQWLMAHCWEYGFILRYPNGKTDITGIIYEPWHYRYVGIDVSTEIHESGVTLEEYLAALS